MYIAPRNKEYHNYGYSHHTIGPTNIQYVRSQRGLASPPWHAVPANELPANYRAEPTYEKYERQLRDVYGDDNIYAPFASKLDWEVARWAKLRGPGSTATTELLGIDEVSKLSSMYQILRTL